MIGEDKRHLGNSNQNPDKLDNNHVQCELKEPDRAPLLSRLRARLSTSARGDVHAAREAMPLRAMLTSFRLVRRPGRPCYPSGGLLERACSRSAS